MLYLLSFKLSEKTVSDPNIYPYNAFQGREGFAFVFSPVTVFYGNNGSGKSTLLNVIANKLQIKGKEYPTANSFGLVDYCGRYSDECRYDLADDEKTSRPIHSIPKDSRYIKSEDILYEIKKIQKRQVLSDGMLYDLVKNGMSKEAAQQYLSSKEGGKQQSYVEFAQEKYSNGETALQYFEDHIIPDALYLLDEPEVSLSPSSQVALAEELNKMARFLGCQFIIATHSPFMLGILNAKIYDLDSEDYEIRKWNELENVRFFYDFFKAREDQFL